MTQEDWEIADNAFKSGNVLLCDSATLQKCLLAISNQRIVNDTIQHRDVVRGITINHILLQRHIDVLQENIAKLNKQNAKTQKLVVALTVASLFGTGAQVWYAVKADKTPIAAPINASLPEKPVKHFPAPNPEKRQEASHSATK